MEKETILFLYSLLTFMLLVGITVSKLLIKVLKVNARVLAMSDCAIEAIDLSFMGEPINFTTCYLVKVPYYEKNLNESLKKYGWNMEEKLK